MDFLTLVIWFVAALIVLPLVFKVFGMVLWAVIGLGLFLTNLFSREPPNY